MVISSTIETHLSAGVAAAHAYGCYVHQIGEMGESRRRKKNAIRFKQRDQTRARLHRFPLHHQSGAIRWNRTRWNGTMIFIQLTEFLIVRTRVHNARKTFIGSGEFVWNVCADQQGTSQKNMALNRVRLSFQARGPRGSRQSMHTDAINFHPIWLFNALLSCR